MELCRTRGLESHYSTQPYKSLSSIKTEDFVPSLIRFFAAKRLWILLGVMVLGVATGCHRNNTTSGYGIGWVTLTTEPHDFVSYTVTVQSVTFTGKTVGSYEAVGLPELVDFTKLRSVSELWEGASFPNDTYTQAAITLDYTSANISVLVNGVPVKCTVVDSTGAAVTTQTVTINFDPTNQLVIVPTYATTSAVRLAFDFDMALSNAVTVNTSASPVTAKIVLTPFLTAATSAMDKKLIRVRGPMVNSNVALGTYSIYVRPFFDEVNTAGTLSIFADSNSVFTVNGTSYLGATAGIGQFSQSSTGSTITSALTTYEPTATPSATAGKFHAVTVVAGSSLQDFYTVSFEGEVIARSGNTLTMRGVTYDNNAANAVLFVQTPDYIVKVGPGTIVTKDGVANQTFDYNSIAVGQHIIARGLIPSAATSAGVLTLDATSTSAVNTGSVRLISTELYGAFVSATGTLATLNLANINQYPASIYNFAGNGSSTANDPKAASFAVDFSSLSLPGLAGGDGVWFEGYMTKFGTAPPDFDAAAVNNLDGEPARLLFTWTGTGTSKPFTAISNSGLSINLSNTSLASAVLRTGAASMDLKTAALSPDIVPDTGTAPAASGLPSVYLPLFSVGPTSSDIDAFNTYSSFVTKVSSLLGASTPANVLKLSAVGSYNRATNTFTASTINVLL
jgi:hypothetical protein